MLRPRRCRSRALRIEVWPRGEARAMLDEPAQDVGGPLDVVGGLGDLRQPDEGFGEDAVGVRHRLVMGRLRPHHQRVGALRPSWRGSRFPPP